MLVISQFYVVLEREKSQLYSMEAPPALHCKEDEAVKDVVSRIKFVPLQKILNGQTMTIQFQASLGCITRTRFNGHLKFANAADADIMGQLFKELLPGLQISKLGHVPVTPEEIAESLWHGSGGKEVVDCLSPQIPATAVVHLIASYLFLPMKAEAQLPK